MPTESENAVALAIGTGLGVVAVCAGHCLTGSVLGFCSGEKEVVIREEDVESSTRHLAAVFAQSVPPVGPLCRQSFARRHLPPQPGGRSMGRRTGANQRPAERSANRALRSEQTTFPPFRRR